MPQGLSKSPSCFSQTLKAYLDDVKSPRGSKLLQHVDDLLLCSPFPGLLMGRQHPSAKAFSLKET